MKVYEYLRINYNYHNIDRETTRQYLSLISSCKENWGRKCQRNIRNAPLVNDIAAINIIYVATGKIWIVLTNAHAAECNASERLHILDVYFMEISKRRERYSLALSRAAG